MNLKEIKKEIPKKIKEIKKEIAKSPKGLTAKEKLDFITVDTLIDMVYEGTPLFTRGNKVGICSYLGIPRRVYNKWFISLDVDNRNELNMALNSQIYDMHENALQNMVDCSEQIDSLDCYDDDYFAQSTKIKDKADINAKIANLSYGVIREEKKDGRVDRKNEVDNTFTIIIDGETINSDKNKIEEMKKLMSESRK